MIRALFSLYRPDYARVIAYMLQSTEYQPQAYIKWFWRTKDFSQVMKRRALDTTKAARVLLLTLRAGIMLEIIAGIFLIIFGLNGRIPGGVPFGIVAIIIYPFVWAHLIIIPLVAGNAFIIKPRQNKQIARAKDIFLKHKGVRIAIAGSYGKTTMKELLNTVLSVGKKVAATPANKNVASSHAIFAFNLAGDEDVLLIEYGEGAPGDVKNFTRNTQPTHAVITGLAPAHLDQYKTLITAGKDIFSVADIVPPRNIYVNSEVAAVREFLKPDYRLYSAEGVDNWKIDKIELTIHGLSFDISNKDRTLHLHSKLLGRHQLGPLALVVALAADFGMTDDQIVYGVSLTAPYEHRMQPYQLKGAWIIDDTYNGNIEGIRAGTQLLGELSADRKWYVTPGLVDQGEQTSKIHHELGTLIARAKPDVVVLMKNSVTEYIQSGLESEGYGGELRIETDPLDFYMNLEHFIAVGDIVLMQNDWTDNYA